MATEVNEMPNDAGAASREDRMNSVLAAMRERFGRAIYRETDMGDVVLVELHPALKVAVGGHPFRQPSGIGRAWDADYQMYHGDPERGVIGRTHHVDLDDPDPDIDRVAADLALLPTPPHKAVLTAALLRRAAGLRDLAPHSVLVRPSIATLLLPPEQAGYLDRCAGGLADCQKSPRWMQMVGFIAAGETDMAELTYAHEILEQVSRRNPVPRPPREVGARVWAWGVAHCDRDMDVRDALLSLAAALDDEVSVDAPVTGADLKAIRSRLGLTQDGFARLLGIHRVTLANLERDPETKVSEMVSANARRIDARTQTKWQIADLQAEARGLAY